jgi:hypothetical protein
MRSNSGDVPAVDHIYAEFTISNIGRASNPGLHSLLASW